MAGIYFHIPFCRKACHYCNFHFSTLLKYRDTVLHAMHTELEARTGFMDIHEVETIYFGGGTPSVLPLTALESLMNHVHRLFRVDTGAEITLEANPDDLSPEYLKGLRQAGINRISLGIQSFDDAVLRWMNRSHDSRQAIRAIELCRTAGFENLNADLIYGIPGTGSQYWKEQLEQMFALGPPHLSVYALTVEEGTVLGHRVAKQLETEAPEEQVAAEYHLLCRVAASQGYVHYEISNLARKGFEARHNSAYWRQKPYLGIGPGAHSFNRNTRQWNITNNALYVKRIQSGAEWFGQEKLTPQDQLNEYIMTGRRTLRGINRNYIRQKWGPEETDRISHQLQSMQQQGQAMKNGNIWQLTEEAWLISDRLIAELFHV